MNSKQDWIELPLKREKPEWRPKRKPTKSERVDIFEVYVTNLYFRANESQVREIFSDCGEISEVTLHRDDQGKSKGTAWIQFKEPRAVSLAIAKHNSVLFGRRIKVIKVSQTNAKTIFVGNIGEIEEAELISVFRKCGDMKEVRIARDHQGALKGYAHIDFYDASCAKNALKLHGEFLHGRPIRVYISNYKEGPRINKN